jgi:nitroimidazol reductase NimA-like FMN-containing flavoprotein (pyridoxamine 5'-phosphate oxidase superfamily)
VTIATADATGRPWASPVYYAAAKYTEFFWVSSPEATHSRNIAARPEVSIVVFDSRAPVGQAQASGGSSTLATTRSTARREITECPSALDFKCT